MTAKRTRKRYPRTYRLTAIIRTTRKMVGRDEFLICTAQPVGLKRKHMTADVIRQTVSELPKPSRKKVKRGK